MMDESEYYSLFKAALERQNKNLAAEFERRLAETGSPRWMWLWLDQLRQNGKLPAELEKPLSDFYSLCF